ncbi:HAD family hydrolase [Patescibacteria group bacterium]
MRKPTWIVFDVTGVLIKSGKIDPDAWNLAKNLRKAGYKLAIFTNAITTNYSIVHKKSESENPKIFETIIKSSSKGFLKPEPESYRYVESILKASGDEIFFIDDFPENTSAARELFNWQVHTFGSVEELRKLLLT